MINRAQLRRGRAACQARHKRTRLDAIADRPSRKSPDCQGSDSQNAATDSGEKPGKMQMGASNWQFRNGNCRRSYDH